jgi:hypothetical protein
VGVTIKKPDGKATVTKALEENKMQVASEETTESVAVPKEVAKSTASPDPFCEVGFSAGYTHPLAPFKSAKVGIMLKVPCLHSEIDTVYDFAADWVDKRLAALKAELEA